MICVCVCVCVCVTESESEWFIEKSHGLMSVVVMNIVKQLSINVKLLVQHLSRPDGIAYSKNLL